MALDNIDISLMFNLEPEDAVNYLENKGYKITQNWHEMLADAHAKAFTVSKMTDAQLLKDTRETVTQAIKEGWSSGKAERKLRDMFVSKGWLKPEGTDGDKAKEKEYKKYMAFRAKTIFRTNMQTAYSAGRYLEQLQDVDFAPYLQYNCIVDSHTRPEHLALHGKVYRYDDEFWASFYPPNGWGCRCYIINLTEKEVQRKGLKIEKTKDGEIGVDDIVVDEKTNKTAQSAFIKTVNDSAGVVFVRTDAGWAHNTGTAAWHIDVRAYNEIKDLPPKVKDRFISDMALNLYKKEAFIYFVDSVIKNGLKAKGIEKTVTWLKPEVLTAAASEKISIKTPVVVMQDSRIGHIIGDVKVDKQKISDKQLFKIYDIINKPDGVYIDTGDKSMFFVKKLPASQVIEGREYIKVVIKLGRFKKGRIPVNYLATASRISKADLRNPKYKKIE